MVFITYSTIKSEKNKVFCFETLEMKMAY